MRIVHKALVVASSLVVAGLSHAAGNNLGFETGDASGWASNGFVTVDGTDVAVGGGSYSALITAGLGTNVYSWISQAVSLAAGETVSGAAKWIGADYLPFNDSGAVAAIQFIDPFVPPTVTNLFQADIATYGDYGSSPWTYFTFTAPTTGSYTLWAGVKNFEDNDVNSSLRVDFSVTAVPEPETYAMMLAGLGVMGFMARRRKPQA